MDECRVWVGNLAAYNAGRLVGDWVDATDEDAVRELFAKVTRGGEVEHYIGDVDGPKFFRDTVGEYGGEDVIIGAAELLAAVDGNAESFAAWLDMLDTYEQRDAVKDPAGTVERFEDEFRGTWDSIGEYAEELATDCAGSREDADRLRGGEWPYSCIDWERAGRELVMGGDVWTADAGGGSVHVFGE